MKTIVVVTARDLDYLVHMIKASGDALGKVSVCIDGGLKIKVNEGMWTPPLGHPIDSNGQRIG